MKRDLGRKRARPSLAVPALVSFALCYCPSLLVLNNHPMVFVAAQSSQSSRKYEREQTKESRREERKRRRYQQFDETYVQHEHYYFREHRQGEEKRKNTPNGEYHEEEVDMESLKQLYDIYKSLSPGQQSPRHVLQGVVRGVKCALYGLLTGLPFLVGLPIAFSKIDSIKSWIGAIIGLAIGGIASALLTIIGIINGLFQVAIGLWNTPLAASSYFFQGKIWNDDENKWEAYSLDEESEELLNSTNFFSEKVSDSTYYSLLGVLPGATSKDIKKGYYSKAKDLHPDKNKGNEGAAQKFILLHEAYETLIDPDKRAYYDSVGKRSSSSSSNSSLGNFSVGVFFEILFGSQLVEPYIGQLGVSTFFSSCVKFLEANSRDSSKATLESFTNMFQASQTQKKQRPVQVALHLREFVKSYVNKDISKEEYQSLCSNEADKIAENTFGEIFLFHIGNALMQESSLFLSQSFFRWPLWIATSSKEKMHRVQEKVEGVRMIAKFVSKLVLGQENSNTDSFIDKIKKVHSGEEKLNMKVTGETLEKMLPHILEMAWAYNAQDIANILKQACEKVLFDSKAATSSERRQRAKALYILGETFFERGVAGTEQCLSDETSRTCSPANDPLDIKARLDVAFRAAQQQ